MRNIDSLKHTQHQQNNQPRWEKQSRSTHNEDDTNRVVNIIEKCTYVIVYV